MKNLFQEVKSPCLKVCKLDTNKTVCIGCYRTLDEIGEWSRATNQRRQEIVDAARARSQALATSNL